jgi:hypothetical protein
MSNSKVPGAGHG